MMNKREDERKIKTHSREITKPDAVTKRQPSKERVRYIEEMS